MNIKYFLQISKMPKRVLIGLVGQFLTMPFISFSLATAAALPPEIPSGIILVG
ncbi:hypothetical protein [Paraglaciecola psychrophila]|nr:hypothetical protein [Paraglaciecola psychrophila]